MGFSLKKLLSSEGTRVPHHKETANFPTEQLPMPEKIIMPMSQHVGAPCTPCVAKGDQVYVGTMIGKLEGGMGMPIFSSVSGIVEKVQKLLHKTGKEDELVYIIPDGLQTPDPAIKPPVVTDYESFIDALSMSGIVGLGGAGFPTDKKIQPKNLAEIDTLLINGAECEPYLTTDNREMVECSDSILYGIHACLQFLGIPQAKICIEDNKPEAISILKEKTADDPKVSICVLESRYPQGAQNILIHNATGRVVARGARHTSVGVIMLNVTTVSSIGKFLKTGMPLVSKRLTVAGDAIKNPKNLEVPIGTPMRDAIKYCGLNEEPAKIIVGGPMMGNAQMDDIYPITRQNNGLLVLTKKSAPKPAVTACIRCGKCVNSCPVGLTPLLILDAYQNHDAAALDKYMADLCISCGTCSYVCPAKRPLTQYTTLAKTFLKNQKRGSR